MRKYILFFALVLLFFGMLGQNVSTYSAAKSVFKRVFR